MCQSYIGGDKKNVFALRNNIKTSTRFPIVFHFPFATSLQLQQPQKSRSENTNYNSKSHRKLHMLSLENGTKLPPKSTRLSKYGQCFQHFRSNLPSRLRTRPSPSNVDNCGSVQTTRKTKPGPISPQTTNIP